VGDEFGKEIEMPEKIPEDNMARFSLNLSRLGLHHQSKLHLAIMDLVRNLNRKEYIIPKGQWPKISERR